MVGSNENYNMAVVLYRDTFADQNLNKVMITTILSCLTRSSNTTKVVQKFLESRSSQMECDSMHSAIERAAAKTEVELPSVYIKLMKPARKQSKPYHVVELCHDDVIDYSLMLNQAFLSNAFMGIINARQLQKYPTKNAAKNLMVAAILPLQWLTT